MLKVEASPFVKVIVFKDTEDVVINDPVFVVPPDPVSTVKLKVVAFPLVKVIVFEETEALFNKEPVSTVPPPPLPLTVVKTTLPSSFIDKTFTLSSSGTERRKTSETNTFCPLPSVLTENFLFSAISTYLNLHR